MEGGGGGGGGFVGGGGGRVLGGALVADVGDVAGVGVVHTVGHHL